MEPKGQSLAGIFDILKSQSAQSAVCVVIGPSKIANKIGNGQNDDSVVDNSTNIFQLSLHMLLSCIHPKLLVLRKLMQ